MSTPTFPIAIDKTAVSIEATSGVFTLTLNETNGILVGSRVDIGGLPTAAWNTLNEEVTAVDATLKTITYTHGNFTIAKQDVWGQVHIETSWASVADVEVWLGYTPTGDELTHLTTCVDAANDRCYKWRANAGYQDHPNVSPGSDIKEGVILYAAILFRERGTTGDNYGSFNAMGQFAQPVTLGRVKQLLGIGRAQVA